MIRELALEIASLTTELKERDEFIENLKKENIALRAGLDAFRTPEKERSANIPNVLPPDPYAHYVLSED